LIPAYKKKLMAENLKQKASDAISNVYSDIGGLARFQYKKTDEIKDPTMKDRLTWAALGGLMGLAGSIVTPKMIPKKIIGSGGFPIALKAGITLSGATAGYFAPDVRNIMIEEKKGLVSREEAKRAIRDYGKIDEKVFRNIGEIAAIPMEKKAFIGGAIRGGFSLGKRGLTAGARKIWGTRLGKAAVIGAGGYGAYEAGRVITRKPYEQNYTTFLRNQTLRGNIQPGEMSQSDLISVRKLGMR
jgi:hypothetical protein